MIETFAPGVQVLAGVTAPTSYGFLALGEMCSLVDQNEGAHLTPLTLLY